MSKDNATLRWQSMVIAKGLSPFNQRFKSSS